MHKKLREKSNFKITSNSPTILNAPSTGGVKGGYSFTSKTLTSLFTIMIMALVVVGGLFVANVNNTQSAHAGILEDWTCDGFRTEGSAEYDFGWGTTNINPEIGIANMLAGIQNGPLKEKMTAYEVYGVAGATFTDWRSADRQDLKKDNALSPRYTFANGSETINLPEISENSPYWANDWTECAGIPGVGNGIANFILLNTKIGVVIINFVYGVATDSSAIMVPFYDAINNIIKSLNDSLYTPFIILMVMLGALWMIIPLIRRKATVAFQGALWMVGAAITGLLLLLNPTFIPNTANTIVTAFTQAVTQTITSTTVQNLDNPLCEVNHNDNANTAISTGSRVMQCAIWYNVLYTPWVVGQFGVSPSLTNSASPTDKAILGGGGTVGQNGYTETSLRMANSVQINLGGNNEVPLAAKTWPLIQLNAQALNINTPESGDTRNAYVRGSSSAVAYQQLALNENTTWKGTDPFPRATIAGTSFLSTLATGLLVLITGLAILVYEFSTIFLVFLMPVFLLIGVHPGFGRRLSLRWLEMIANLTIKRIMSVILLALFIMLYALVMGMTDVFWLLQNILILVITITGLMYRTKLMNAFGNVNFGGDKSALNPSNNGAGVKKVAGAVVGAGVAAAAAASGVGALGVAAVGAAGSAVSGSGKPGQTPGGSGEPIRPQAPTVAPTGGSAVPGATAPKTAAAAAALSGGKPQTQPQSKPVQPAPTVQLPTQDVTPTVQLPTQSPGAIVDTPEQNNPLVDDSNPEIAAQNKAEQARIDALKRKVIRDAATQGAIQGFTSGAKGAVLGAAMTGLSMGDNVHDNEVNRQEMKARELREQERNNLMSDSLNRDAEIKEKERADRLEKEAREQAQKEADEKRTLSVKEWREQKNNGTLPQRKPAPQPIERSQQNPLDKGNNKPLGK